MPALIFSAFGHRWRVQRLDNERLPDRRSSEPTVTGLYFESDTASARFLPLQPALLLADKSLGEVPFQQWPELLSWADELSPAGGGQDLEAV